MNQYKVDLTRAIVKRALTSIIASRALDVGHGNIARATADYGTKYLIVAGLLNIISATDAYHIAIGKKQ